jgi:hypothetical protein
MAAGGSSPSSTGLRPEQQLKGRWRGKLSRHFLIVHPGLLWWTYEGGGPALLRLTVVLAGSG